MFEDAIGSALGIETSAKLYISNLDYGVSNEDIKELFSEVGELKHYAIHYDRSGRSIGTADVVFVRRADAINALKRYNNVQLDGKPMKIELIGTGVFSPAIRGVYGGSSIGRGRVSGFIGRLLERTEGGQQKEGNVLRIYSEILGGFRTPPTGG
ncbi:hypothetical protein KP509_10G088300 [Ceratopteris richardii]|uniref:RRM domain-containing protein n=1 Tax=Ceratopteris richardii TaxID=49495 RepID=A0A8T2TZF2_CERRI|nr:hypothetical protein KP509_10G088300 [Ceratopteris richardii]